MNNNKRKRTEKSVRFDIENVEIIDTWSAMDYDRGRQPILQYKINSKQKSPKLSLDIPPNLHSERSLENPSSDSDDSTMTSTINKKRKPKLTVNTRICTTEGPLFFTKLSTNHYKHSMSSDSEEDYLVPITP